MKIEELFFDLNRPEYAVNPESLLSALAWKVYDDLGHEPGAKALKEKKPVGFIYRRETKRQPRNVPITKTSPELADLVEFFDELKDKGLGLPPGEGDDGLVAKFIARGIEGVRPAKAKGVAVTPLVKSLAFYQNGRGAQAKENPPNFAKIIERLYCLGSDGPVSDREASSLWYKQLSAGGDRGFFRLLDATFGSWAQAKEWVEGIPAEQEEPELEPNFEIPRWLVGERTPFTWFNKSWKVFCSPEWRNALPHQRWSDWGSCLIRTALGLGFLWESRFYSELGRWLLDSETEEGLDSIFQTRWDLLYWLPATSGLSTRDQFRRIKGVVYRGTVVRAFLKTLIEDEDVGEVKDKKHDLVEIGKWLKEKCEPGTDRYRELEASYQDPESADGARTANNTFETILYNLNSRQDFGRGADFYGFLVTRSRRFRVVEPGKEWIVVIASLLAKKPKGNTLLRDLRQELSELCLEVGRDTLIEELERAGLTRSAHDADDAIIVQSGF